MASFNAAIRLRTGPDPDHHIDLIQQTFAHRSMPFIWWVTREDSQDGLETKLRNRGLHYYGVENHYRSSVLSIAATYGHGSQPCSNLLS